MKSYLFVLFLLLASNLFAVSEIENALIHAATKGDIPAMKNSLDQGANVNAMNAAAGWTALTAAVYFGYPEAVDFLIHAGGDPNHVDFNGGTPLMKAVTLGSFSDFKNAVERKSEIIKMLLQAGAD